MYFMLSGSLYAAAYAAAQRVTVTPLCLCLPMLMIIKMAAISKFAAISYSLL